MTISFSGGVQLSQGVNLAVTEYDPSFLYLLGGTGAWYDPSDLTTMYQDSSGAAAVTDVSQNVGLILDKSRGAARSAELITNGGPFTDTTGWIALNGATLSVVGNKLRVTGNGTTSFPTAAWNLTTVVGQTYFFSANSTFISGTGQGVEIQKSDGTGGFVNGEVGQFISGRWYLRFVATSTTSTLRLKSNDPNNVVEWDTVKCFTVPGNHATQATAAQRPTLGRNPVTGTRNLLTYTEQFDNAVWGNVIGGTGVNPVVTVDAGTSPISEVTADRIQFNLGGGTTTADISRRRQNITLAAGSHTFSVYLKSFDGSSTYNMHLTDASGVTRNITVTGSWQRFDVSGVAAGGIVAISIGLRGGQSPANNNTADVLVWGAQLETGSTATAYQKVVSQYDVTETGVTDAYYLAFDGSDDWMITNTITPGIDKAQVFAGVRKLSDAARGILVELGSAPASNAINVSAPGGASATYSIGGGGSLFVGPISTSASYSAPITNVLAVTDDIAADNGSLRVNGGAAQQLLTTDQGTGNFAANPLYLGRRGGTTLPFNGRLYSLIVRFGGNLDSTTIQNTETWVNSKTGAY